MEEISNSETAPTAQPKIAFVKRSLPPRPTSANDVYVNQKTKLSATFMKCRKLLDQKLNFLDTLRLANMLKDAMKGSIAVNVRTGTVTVTDHHYEETADDADRRSVRRKSSVVHVRIQRLTA
ncbi:Ribonuclease P protein subunit p20 [Aphelenchoides fujianensis]|nr:Ribonuclease P protein subunit p20 [Aphelenchoides fujianensis]